VNNKVIPKPNNERSSSQEIWLTFKIGVVMLIGAIGLTSYLELQYVRESNASFASQFREIQDSKSRLDTQYRNALTRWVYENSEKINYSTAREIVDGVLSNYHPVLILAVMEVESSFNPMAVSKKGAVGLGQVMYGTWGKILEKEKIIKSKRDLFGVKDNIMATGYILNAYMEESKGDVIAALRKYLGTSHTKYENRVFSNYVRLSILRNEGG